MAEDKKLQVIKKLLREESRENDLISIYLSLLDVGVDKCLSKEKRAEFQKDMEVLFKDSVRHKKVVNSLFTKYNK